MINIGEAVRRESGLSKLLGPYQLAMVAVGVIISFGLLSGASFPLTLAGSGVALSYIFASIVALLMAFCLAEMASRHPTPGAFGTYAEVYLGPASGFMVRSAYVIGLLLVIGTEVELLGMAAGYALPGVPNAAVSAAGLLAVIALNLLHVKWFARLECVLATIQIAALVAFVVFAWRLLIAPEVPNFDRSGLPDTATLWNNMGVWQAFVLAVLGYAGLESLAVAAGEAAVDASRLRRTIRIASCGIVGLAVAVAITAAALAVSGLLPITMRPASVILAQYGASERWFQALLAIAVVSVINGQLYVASRMLFSFGRASSRSSWLGRLDGGVPRRAVVLAGLGALLVFGSLQLYAYQTFVAATTIATCCWLLVWLMGFLTYLRFRRSVTALHVQDRGLAAWPAWVGVALIVLIVISTWQLPLFNSTLQIGGPFLGVLWFCHFCINACSKRAS